MTTTAPLHTREATEALDAETKRLAAITGLDLSCGYIGGNLTSAARDHRIWYVWINNARGGGLYASNTTSVGGYSTAEDALRAVSVDALRAALSRGGVYPVEVRDWRLEVTSTQAESRAKIDAFLAS